MFTVLPRARDFNILWLWDVARVEVDPNWQLIIMRTIQEMIHRDGDDENLVYKLDVHIGLLKKAYGGLCDQSL